MIRELSVETVSSCNMKCIMCPREGFTRNHSQNVVMTDDVFDKILDYIKNNNIKMVCICGTSEPLLDRKLTARIKRIKEVSSDTFVFFITNGRLLSPEVSRELGDAQLDAITVSFDGASKKTYEKIRVGSNYNKVLENISSFAKINPSINLVVSCVVLKDVYPEMENFVQMFIEREIKAINFASMFSYCSEYQKNLSMDKEIVFSRARELKKQYMDKITISISDDSFYSRCMDGALQRVYIGASGLVSPCDQLHYAIFRMDHNSDGSSNHFALGSLKDSSLQELVSNKEYLDFVENLRRSKTRPKLCSNCPGYTTYDEDIYLDQIEHLNNIIDSLIRPR